MANVPKAITDLPVASAMGDDDLLVVSQNATTSSIKGELIKGYAQNAVTPQVTAAQTAANQAGQSATQAEAARQGAAAAQTAAESAQDAAETARDQSVAAAGTIGDSVEQAQTAAGQASSAKDAAVAAQSAAETAKTAAETASGQAQTAATQATGSATAAQTAATQAGDAKTDAETARNEAETSASSAANSASDAESAATGAEQAKIYIENMDMEGETLPAGSSVTVTKTTSPEGNLLFVIGVPQGIQGDKGDPGETGATGPQGVSITNATVNEDGDLVITFSAGEPINAGSVIGPQGIQGEVGPTGASVDRIERTSGTGAPGTTDTYTLYLTDGKTGGTFQVYNGSNGTGSGDFMSNGTVPMTGDLQMGGHVVTGMADGTNPTDGATVGQLSGKLDSPTGGTAGQVLTKTDTGEEWADAPDGLPTGGTEGQVLTKIETGSEWATPVGKSLAGETVEPTEGVSTTAGTGAEIFNDYRPRDYDSYVGNVASGDYSHAEGSITTASGDYSHAEGSITTASGDYSHAEGSITTASGDYSHAEGSITTASGDYSHAEGEGTIASGPGSHAEGCNAIVSGMYAHAEGYITTARGNWCHAEGYKTEANENGSHAEGTGTIAGSIQQHVQGKYNKADASGAYAHIVGNGSDDSHRSNAHTLDWDGNAWFAGEVYVGGTSQSNGIKLMPTPTGGTTGQVLTKTSTGEEWSDAPSGLPEGGTEGQIIEKTDTGATWADKPIGLPAQMNILETICENVELTDEEPSYTFPSAITLDNDAIYFLNYTYYDSNEKVDEANSSSVFSEVETTTSGSFVRWLTSNESNSITMRSSNIEDTWREAGAKSSFSIYKVEIEVTDHENFAAMSREGFETISSGSFSHAEGTNTVASGNYAHAEGTNTVASGNYAHAEGTNTVASGDGSHAEGQRTAASGSYSHAEGGKWSSGDDSSKATGYAAHAEGSSTVASGRNAHAEGLHSVASGDYSAHAEGYGTIASGDNQHAQGKYNIEDDTSTYAHIVGNGTSNSNRSNAHTLDWDGNAWFSGDVFVGGTNQSDGDKLMKEPTGTQGQLLGFTSDNTVGAVDAPESGLTQEQADERYLQLNSDAMIAGDVTFKYGADFDGSKITSVGTPVNGSDGANKAYVDSKAPTSVAITLTADGWTNTMAPVEPGGETLGHQQTVTVSGVSATETAQLITPTPAIASQSAYYEAGIMCTGQAANSLTFTCQTVPTSNLTVYVVIQPLS